MNRPEHELEIKLTEALALAVALGNEINRLKRENDFLRALCGTSEKSCVYCGLGAEQQGQCKLGFPGCSRADDQMLCREVGVALERDELKKALAAAHKEIVAAREYWESQCALKIDGFKKSVRFIWELAGECMDNGDVRVGQAAEVAMRHIWRKAEELMQK